MGSLVASIPTMATRLRTRLDQDARTSRSCRIPRLDSLQVNQQSRRNCPSTWFHDILDQKQTRLETIAVHSETTPIFLEQHIAWLFQDKRFDFLTCNFLATKKRPCDILIVSPSTKLKFSFKRIDVLITNCPFSSLCTVEHPNAVIGM